MRRALVAGALGVTGRELVQHLMSLGDWDVIGLSRRNPEFQTGAKFLSVNLLNRPEVEAQLSEIDDVTHVFYAALQPAVDFFAEVEPNLSMLRNLVETVEQRSAVLRKVVLLEGAKFYGAHFGPYKTPAKETDPRHMPPNFYYNQEDYLKERSAGKSWSWTALQPSCICGFAVGNPRLPLHVHARGPAVLDVERVHDRGQTLGRRGDLGMRERGKTQRERQSAQASAHGRAGEIDNRDHKKYISL